MTAPHSLWMQRLHTALEQLGDIPLWGKAPPFPWKALSQRLSEDFSLPELEIAPATTEFLEEGKLTNGLGESPYTITLSLSPLFGEVFWIFPRKEVMALTQLITSEEEKGLSDAARAEGFYLFTALKTLQLINEMQALEDLRLSIASSAPLPEEGGFTLNISITLKGQTFWGRLLLPPPIHAAFNNHFATRKTFIFPENLKAMHLPLALSIGSTTLRQNQLHSIAVGDFLLLDRCSYDPETERGTAHLVLGSTALFDVRLKGKEAKLLEYALFQEEEDMIDNDDEDQDFPEDTFPSHPSIEENHEEAPLWSAKNGDNTPVKDLIGKGSIPITLTVEVSKLQMPLEKVLQLEPGNVLELGVNPGLGVYLSAGGKRIAKGELIKLGESLGVKILSIGN